jgi:hypothetical protein
MKNKAQKFMDLSSSSYLQSIRDSLLTSTGICPLFSNQNDTFTGGKS